MNIARNESPKILTIITLGYRARCTQAGCTSLGSVILRHFDAGGRPMDNAEFGNAHAKVRIERDRMRLWDLHDGDAWGSRGAAALHRSPL
jgi:hypothetical protein